MDPWDFQPWFDYRPMLNNPASVERMLAFCRCLTIDGLVPLRRFALFLCSKDFSALRGVQAVAKLSIKTFHVVVAAFLVLPPLCAPRAFQDQSCIRRHSRDLPA